MRNDHLLVFGELPAEFGDGPIHRSIHIELDDRVLRASGFEEGMFGRKYCALWADKNGTCVRLNHDPFFKGTVVSVDNDLRGGPNIEIPFGAEQDLDRTHVLAGTL